MSIPAKTPPLEVLAFEHNTYCLIVFSMFPCKHFWTVYTLFTVWKIVCFHCIIHIVMFAAVSFWLLISGCNVYKNQGGAIFNVFMCPFILIWRSSCTSWPWHVKLATFQYCSMLQECLTVWFCFVYANSIHLLVCCLRLVIMSICQSSTVYPEEQKVSNYVHM
jgi:hypothetical protein